MMSLACGAMRTSSRVTVPLSTLDTKICACSPLSWIVRNHGPSSSFESLNESTWLPLRSITSSEPCCTVAQVPSVVGTLPTSTNPRCNTPKAVVSPSPCGPWKNTDWLPCCVILTMVVPVPCRFELLLKFDTRMLPACNDPPCAIPFGTNATPYGLTSLFGGTVDTDCGGIIVNSGISASFFSLSANADTISKKLMQTAESSSLHFIHNLLCLRLLPAGSGGGMRLNCRLCINVTAWSQLCKLLVNAAVSPHRRSAGRRRKPLHIFSAPVFFRGDRIATLASVSCGSGR